MEWRLACAAAGNDANSKPFDRLRTPRTTSKSQPCAREPPQFGERIPAETDVFMDRHIPKVSMKASSRGLVCDTREPTGFYGAIRPRRSRG